MHPPSCNCAANIFRSVTSDDTVLHYKWTALSNIERLLKKHYRKRVARSPIFTSNIFHPKPQRQIYVKITEKKKARCCRETSLLYLSIRSDNLSIYMHHFIYATIFAKLEASPVKTRTVCDVLETFLVKNEKLL